ncbi:hypothetical protein [Ichthyenterobacterium magnum]|uniref:Uncharacterized protein n=1 Tax=Ichthyenterobacterium magnum TaxID=1230530 RepID=A0A420DXX7_9FLAO|nr:hypothetical protein [Ichthyenterobacterium magnum]RKE99100.1 hypothetical protein BXY80_1202 [Ichthyenterobacterium magnum]
MKSKQVKRNLVLGVLFFLPVLFLLFLYPAKHNYDPLEVVKENINELQFFSSNNESKIELTNHITILSFLGNKPLNHVIAASNLKELVYDKFKGFKRFQIVIVLPKGTEEEVKQLRKEINNYDDMRFWHYVYGEPNDIKNLFNSLNTDEALDVNLSTEKVFIIDKDLSQRGRLDDREDKEKEKQMAVYGLNSYDCIEVAEIKNKMSDDLRILFTEYRQKRKGNFDSSKRRAGDLKAED